MIICHQHRLVFAAIPKTGTHSVRHALREHMSAEDLEQVGLFVKNLTNELALYDGLGTFQDPEAVVAAQPRTIGVNARINF